MDGEIGGLSGGGDVGEGECAGEMSVGRGWQAIVDSWGDGSESLSGAAGEEAFGGGEIAEGGGGVGLQDGEAVGQGLGAGVGGFLGQVQVVFDDVRVVGDVGLVIPGAIGLGHTDVIGGGAAGVWLTGLPGVQMVGERFACNPDEPCAALSGCGDLTLGWGGKGAGVVVLGSAIGRAVGESDPTIGGHDGLDEGSLGCAGEGDEVSGLSALGFGDCGGVGVCPRRRGGDDLIEIPGVACAILSVEEGSGGCGGYAGGVEADAGGSMLPGGVIVVEGGPIAGETSGGDDRGSGGAW